MKKVLSILLAVMLILASACAAIAEEIDISGLDREQLNALKARIEERLEELDAEPETGAEEEPAEKSSSPQYVELKRGSKGDAVVALQKRLIELNYLEGSADGDFGGKTERAVSAFQKAIKVDETGVADPHTQALLFSDNAPAQKVYKSIEYKNMSRDPDQYEGQSYKFSGRVLQVMEDDTYADTMGVYTVLRVSSKGRYDDVVYVTWWRQKSASRVLEDDQVTVYGTYTGLYTYTSTMNAAITIPSIEAERIDVK